MNLFIVDLKHQPGELAKACDAIAKQGIDITAFSGVTCGDSGTVALLTNDDSGTRNALADAGFRAREHEVVTTTIENTPGSLAKAAWKLDQGSFARKEISMAKIQVAEALQKAVDTAIQLCGARGYSKDTPLEWMYRYARQARLVDGASEIHKMVLAGAFLAEGPEFWT